MSAAASQSSSQLLAAAELVRRKKAVARAEKAVANADAKEALLEVGGMEIEFQLAAVRSSRGSQTSSRPEVAAPNRNNGEGTQKVPLTRYHGSATKLKPTLAAARWVKIVRMHMLSSRSTRMRCRSSRRLSLPTRGP